MLNIKKSTNENGLTVVLTGRLDTITAPELEKELKASLDGVSALTIDMAALEYISSAAACAALRPEDHEQAGRDEGRARG